MTSGTFRTGIPRPLSRSGDQGLGRLVQAPSCTVPEQLQARWVGEWDQREALCENKLPRFQYELILDPEWQDTHGRCADWLRGRHPDTSGVVGGERGGDSCLLFKCL